MAQRRSSWLVPLRIAIREKALVLLALMIVPMAAAHANEIDMDIETEAAFADSEGAIAEAEESEKRAAEEKKRAQKEAEHAKQEAERARKFEADAKKKLARYLEEEKKHKADFAAAAARTKVATDKIQKIQTDLSAREIELAAAREATQRAVTERDQAELALKKMLERVAQVERQMAEDAKRRADAEKATAKNKAALAAAQEKFKSLRRNPANVKQQGWVTAKRGCAMRSEAAETAAETAQVPAGDRLVGRRHGTEWLWVKTQNGSTGYMPISCFR